MGTWGKHMKSPCFRTLRSHQKINHFPGTFQIGRKDRLWRNMHKYIIIYYSVFIFLSYKLKNKHPLTSDVS